MLAKLRWMYEELPKLAVIAAGSLLDFVLADHTFSMPVWRIGYYYLEPFSFTEFLFATGNDLLPIRAYVQVAQKNLKLRKILEIWTPCSEIVFYHKSISQTRSPKT